MNNLLIEYKSGDMEVQSNVNFILEKDTLKLDVRVGSKLIKTLDLEKVNLILLETGVDRHILYADEEFMEAQAKEAEETNNQQENDLRQVIQEEVMNVIAYILPSADDEPQGELEA